MGPPDMGENEMPDKLTTTTATAAAGTDTDATDTDGTTTDTTTAVAVTTAADAGDVAKWKALARKHEAAAKANAGAAAKLAEIEAASLSEAEKVAARLAASEARSAALEAKSWRVEAALTHGLTAAQAARLIGSTLEEILADAELFKAELAPAAAVKTTADFGAGARGTDVGAGDLDARIAAAEKAKDWRTSLRLKAERARAASGK